MKATIIYYDDKYFKVVLAQLNTLIKMKSIEGYESYTAKNTKELRKSIRGG